MNRVEQIVETNFTSRREAIIRLTAEDILKLIEKDPQDEDINYLISMLDHENVYRIEEGLRALSVLCENEGESGSGSVLLDRIRPKVIELLWSSNSRNRHYAVHFSWVVLHCDGKFLPELESLKEQCYKDGSHPTLEHVIKLYRNKYLDNK